MLKILKKIDQILLKVSNVFLVFTIIAMVGFAFWQVIARFVLKIPTAYAEEFARLAIVWCILIGGAMAVRKNEHIGSALLDQHTTDLGRRRNADVTEMLFAPCGKTCRG